MMNVSVLEGGPTSEDPLGAQTPDCHQCGGMGRGEGGTGSMSWQSLLQTYGLLRQLLF